jgi:predicted nucleotidyltransferase component of viral defense system
MSSLLTKMMPDPLPQTSDGLVNVLREATQTLALIGLWRAKFFENAAFYGGTALRLLYGLNRYSEDLDFSLIMPSSGIRLITYESALLRELKAFGVDARFEARQKNSLSAIESAFLKMNTYNQMLLIEAPPEITDRLNKSMLLKVKLEIDTNPPLGFDTEMKYVFAPVPFAVRMFALPSAFAGKIHALLYRKWMNRVKGRDWYDFIWYISNHPELKISHLEERMRHSGHYVEVTPLTGKKLSDMLSTAIESLDIDDIRNEMIRFVDDSDSLSIWSKDFFLAAVQRIIIQ